MAMFAAESLEDEIRTEFEELDGLTEKRLLEMRRHRLLMNLHSLIQISHRHRN